MHFYHEQTMPHPRVIRDFSVVFPPHLHRAVEILFLFSGSCTFTVNSIPYTLQAGEALMVFPNCVHSYLSEENVDVGKLIFDIELLPELRERFVSKRPLSPVIARERLEEAGVFPLAEAMFRDFHQCSAPSQKGFLLLLTGKLLDLCQLVDKREEENPHTLNLVLEYCNLHYHEPLSLKAVAKALHISTSHLSYMFSDKINMSFSDYVNTLRVNDATRMLRETELRMTEIVEQSGFPTIRTFNRAVLKHTGLTPTQYRKKYR